MGGVLSLICLIGLDSRYQLVLGRPEQKTGLDAPGQVIERINWAHHAFQDWMSHSNPSTHLLQFPSHPTQHAGCFWLQLTKTNKLGPPSIYNPFAWITYSPPTSSVTFNSKPLLVHSDSFSLSNLLPSKQEQHHQLTTPFNPPQFFHYHVGRVLTPSLLHLQHSVII